VSARARTRSPASKPLPLTRAPSTDADAPCEFLEFLQQTRQLAPAAALAVLGELLANYEPGPLALAKAEPRRNQSSQQRRRAA
jgi:hypothetical protein